MTYNNGGHGTAPSATTASAVTLSALTATGYTCTGWKANVAVKNTSTSATISAGTLIANGTNVTLTAATTFTAQWTAKTTTVSFNQNGGEGGQTTNKTATYGQAMPTPVTLPTREHYDFGGYYDGTGGTGTQYYTNTGASARTWNKETASATLYAKWIEHPLTNYRTQCCSDLETIDLAVASKTQTSVTLTWDKIEGVDYDDDLGNGPFEILDISPAGSYSIGSIDLSGSKAVCTISGLSSNTEYTVTVAKYKDNSGAACDDDMEDITFTTSCYSVSLTSSHVTLDDGEMPATICGDIYALYIPDDGYRLPSSITVTNAGAQGTGWTWDNGELIILKDYVTGNVSVTINAEELSCSNFSFHYGTDGESDWEVSCFGNAVSNVRVIENFQIPSSTHFYVGYQGTWESGNSSATNKPNSATLTWSSLYFDASIGDGSRPMVGQATGATGTVKIIDNSTWTNKKASFIPDGFKLKFGSSTYSDFAQYNGHEYRSGLVTYNSTSADYNVSVGIIDATNDDAYVASANTEAMRHVFLRVDANWASASAKFSVYSIDGSAFKSGFMQAVPGETNLYEGWIAADCDEIIFVRHNSSAANPTWDNKWNQTGDLTLQAGKNLFTIDASSEWNGQTTGWSAYERNGQFRINEDWTDKNWYVRFVPADVLSFHANGGEDAPSAQYVPVDAAVRSITVTSDQPTRTGYTFAGWNPNKASADAGTKDNAWDPGDTHAMSGNVTLYAVWSPNTISLTLNKNNSDATGSSNGSGSIQYNANSATISTAATRTGYTAEGYYSENTCAAANKVLTNTGAVVNSTVSGYTTAGAWTRSTTPTVLYTKWTAKQTTVSFDQNSGTGGQTSSVTATFAQAMPTPITTPTRVGHTFAGYYDGEGGTGTQYYTNTGASARSWDKEGATCTLYAKWTVNSYTLTWNLAGGTVTTAGTGAAVDATGTPSSSVNYGAAITAPIVAKEGYHFTGWNTTPAATMPAAATTYTAQWVAKTYSDYVFSCADLGLEAKLATADAPIFITSTAGKKVRSQDSILIVGNGLTPSTALTFPELPDEFEIKSRTYTNLSTDASGDIDAVAYIFYTPAAGATTDGLDRLSEITVSVGGAKPRQATLAQTIIGRHLPADFVIAAKNTSDGKWYALPADMSAASNPAPVEIQVDNATNPGAAYSTNTNAYNLYGQNSGAGYLEEAGQYVKLGMKNNSNYPLYGYTTTSIKGDGGVTITNNLGKAYWWLMTQTNTDITNAGDAKYTIRSANNANPLKLWLAAGGAGNPRWGLYASGISELRIIPLMASIAEAEIVEWGEHSAVVEVDATAISATKVAARLDGGTPTAKIALSQTLTSVNGGATRYDYTILLGNELDLTAHPGGTLLLEWYNSSDGLVGGSSVRVPRLIAADATMTAIESRKTYWSGASAPTEEVVVLPGATLTANAGDFSGQNVTVPSLEIYPGATVSVSSGTLTATNLVLRNGWTRAGEKGYDVARLHIATTATLQHTNAHADWYIDYDQYYPIAVSWPVTTAGIRYKNSNNAASAGVVIRHYDGESRAEGTNDAREGENWKAYTWGDDMPATLTPGTGYAMTAKRPGGKAFSIVRMPLTFDNDWTTAGEQGSVSTTHKDQVDVTAWGDENTPAYAKGWNWIANPYMALYQGTLLYEDGETEIAYVTVPDREFESFAQAPTETTKLKPASGFFIQAPQDGTLTFATGNRRAAAPSYRRTQQAVAPVQKAFVTLSSEQEEDMMGIIVGEQYTAAYEVNADLTKMLGGANSLKTYMRYGETDMAYLALSSYLAQEWIPVSVHIPAAGEYRFGLHEASRIGELEGVYLTDYQTGDVTNLLYDDYTFESEAGTQSNRFALNALVGERQTPTDLDNLQTGESDGAQKFIYHDRMYILHGDAIYDATGKRVSERRGE